jgi:hypothetical protein
MPHPAVSAGARHPSPKFKPRVYQRRRGRTDGYDVDAPLRDPEETTMDIQTAPALLLGTIGLISALGLIGTVLAFWEMGRAGYRKD